MNKNLFEIQHEYLNTIEELEDFLTVNDSDEIPEQFLERLHINENEFAEKARNYKLVIDLYTGEAEGIEKEINRLKRLVKSKEQTIAKLKELLVEATKVYGTVTKSGGYEFKSPMLKLVNVGTKSLEVTDATVITDEYKNLSINFPILDKTKKEELLLAVYKLTGIDKTDLLKSSIDNAKLKADIIGDKIVEGAKINTNFHVRFY